MARKRKTHASSRESLLKNLDTAYLQWKKWGHSTNLVDRELAMSGCLPTVPPRHAKETREAFQRFDDAICELIAKSKTDMGDLRIIERIKTAQWFGDKKFFRDLAGAIRRNVGVNRKVANDKAVAVLFHCAWHYLSGDKKCIWKEYKYWESFDAEAYLRRYQNTPCGAWAKDVGAVKNSVVRAGLEGFRLRVKALADQLKTGSMPIPIVDRPI